MNYYRRLPSHSTVNETLYCFSECELDRWLAQNRRDWISPCSQGGLPAGLLKGEEYDDKRYSQPTQEVEGGSTFCFSVTHGREWLNLCSRCNWKRGIGWDRQEARHVPFHDRLCSTSVLVPVLDISGTGKTAHQFYSFHFYGTLYEIKRNVTIFFTQLGGKADQFLPPCGQR